MARAKTSTDHDEIRKWVEKRGGHPAVVAETEDDRQTGGLLRIDYDEPGGKDDTRLHRISWDEFFRIFDAAGSRSATTGRTTAALASSSRTSRQTASDLQPRASF